MRKLNVIKPNSIEWIVKEKKRTLMPRDPVDDSLEEKNWKRGDA